MSDSIPTRDTELLIHCCDCVHSFKSNISNTGLYCDYLNKDVNGYQFCTVKDIKELLEHTK